MPRKKQTVQQQRRRKVYREGEFSGEATKLKPKGAFRFFSNYQLFAIIGTVALAGGLALSAFYTGSGTVRNDSGSVRGEDVIRETPQAGETPSTGAVSNIKQYTTAPAMTIDPAKTYFATVKTDKGSFKIELLAGDAPETVNNFVFLANDGFYDGVSFHRVIADFVAQTGDPTGTGSGGPGYTLPVENADDPFSEGTVAMAKPADASSPNNGSQFFITLGDTPTLEGKSTVFGHVVEGLDVVKSLTERDPQLAQDPPPGDRIQSITIEEQA
jgi:cyclophilin family peptidyl-prolyl cis-trans isomerase